MKTGVYAGLVKVGQIGQPTPDDTENSWTRYGFVVGIPIGYYAGKTLLASSIVGVHPFITGALLTALGLTYAVSHIFDCNCGPCDGSTHNDPSDVIQARCERVGATAGVLPGVGLGFIAAGSLPVGLVVAVVYGLMYFGANSYDTQQQAARAVS